MSGSQDAMLDELSHLLATYHLHWVHVQNSIGVNPVELAGPLSCISGGTRSRLRMEAEGVVRLLHDLGLIEKGEKGRCNR